MECNENTRWYDKIYIKCMDVGLGPVHMHWRAMGTRLPFQRKKGVQSPIFGPCLGWMDQDATWYGDRPRLCLCYVTLRRWVDGDASPPEKGTCLLWPWSPISPTAGLLLTVLTILNTYSALNLVNKCSHYLFTYLQQQLHFSFLHFSNFQLGFRFTSINLKLVFTLWLKVIIYLPKCCSSLFVMLNVLTNYLSFVISRAQIHIVAFPLPLLNHYALLAV